MGRGAQSEIAKLNETITEGTLDADATSRAGTNPAIACPASGRRKALDAGTVSDTSCPTTSGNPVATDWLAPPECISEVAPDDKQVT